MQVTGKEMRWPYCARSEERHGLTSVITPRPGSGDVGPPPQPVNPERTPVKKVRVVAHARAVDDERDVVACRLARHAQLS
jgi:hypothetical protein